MAKRIISAIKKFILCRRPAANTGSSKIQKNINVDVLQHYQEQWSWVEIDFSAQLREFCPEST
jgi:hypothetical protein